MPTDFGCTLINDYIAIQVTDHPSRLLEELG